MSAAEVSVRRVKFAWPDSQSPTWHHSMPEFGAGANAVSLLMPHAEPFVVAQLRAGLSEAEVEPELAARADSLIRQETAHLRAHKQFNEALVSQSRTARLLDRIGRAIFMSLAKRSTAFGVAFAAAFEIVAFASARWAEAGLRRYFGGADEQAATLFLWHLAEEIEHKGIAHDVMLAHPTASRSYKLALPVAFVILCGFTAFGGLGLFATTKHVWNPYRWARLVRWAFSFAFVVIPVASDSLRSGFHPDELLDPPWMKMWLSEYDEQTQTMPLWTEAGSGFPANLATGPDTELATGRIQAVDEIELEPNLGQEIFAVDGERHHELVGEVVPLDR